jgi:hypothetical protein
MCRHRFSILIALTLVLLVGGCSSTRLVNQWENPQAVPARFSRILVIGITQQTVMRRLFEDAFVAKLKSEGVDAVPSYQLIPEDGPVAEARLQEAAARAQADGVLMTRLLGVERKTEITPGYYGAPPFVGWGFYPWYSAGWIGFYDPPRVYQYDVYTSETSLYDMPRNQLVWAGTVQTERPGDLNKEIQRYAEIVVKALKREQILA